MALLGCDVILTDQVEVLPLLIRNVERSTARVVQSDRNSDSFGSIAAAELDWENEDHIRAVELPFDYIIGTDVVYAEHLLEPLLQTIFALLGPKTVILLGHEIYSTIVHKKMLAMWRSNFEVKIIQKAKMHYKYQHSTLHDGNETPWWKCISHNSRNSRADTESTGGRGNGRKGLSLDQIWEGMVMEIRRVILVHPMLVITTKATILGDAASVLTTTQPSHHRELFSCYVRQILDGYN